MRRFRCQKCASEVFFDSTECVTCKSKLGYRSEKATMTVVPPGEAGPRPAGAPVGALAGSKAGSNAPSAQLCVNAQFDACNWLVNDPEQSPYCVACSHNRTIPDLSMPSNLANWRRMELAKHHLFYSLLRLKLPLGSKEEQDTRILVFDFLADSETTDGSSGAVLTGHDEGVITINVAEADDALRETARTQMGEPYRTLLGHFRHEIGHYYWDVLVSDANRLEGFRELFGDERRDYAQALEQHYKNGPPQDWQSSFISTYASSHPWEDFAETWAHYFHMVDSLETARAYGMSLQDSVVKSGDGDTAVEFDPYSARTVTDIIDVWVPFTVALNSLNRSMGQHDFYPFVLNDKVLEKLRYIHALMRGKK